MIAAVIVDVDVIDHVIVAALVSVNDIVEVIDNRGRSEIEISVDQLHPLA